MAMLDEHPPELQTKIWQAITEAARQYITADGKVRMPNQAICVVGHR